MADRRHSDRRLPPGTCATDNCQHLYGDHIEGTGKCLAPECECQQFTPPPTPKKQAAPKRKAQSRHRSSPRKASKQAKHK